MSQVPESPPYKHWKQKINSQKAVSQYNMSW